jgi:hypothetical protein
VAKYGQQWPFVSCILAGSCQVLITIHLLNRMLSDHIQAVCLRPMVACCLAIIPTGVFDCLLIGDQRFWQEVRDNKHRMLVRRSCTHQRASNCQLHRRCDFGLNHSTDDTVGFTYKAMFRYRAIEENSVLGAFTGRRFIWQGVFDRPV